MKIKNGFTLVELLLYIAIVAIVLAAVSMFIFLTFQTRVKNQVINEVEQNGAQAMNIITQTIRNAQDITSPAQGISSSSLTLDVVDSASDPTVFDLSSGVIRITEGAGSSVALTNSSRISVSNLSFYNVSRNNTPGIIRTQFTLSHLNPSNKSEYDYSRTFYASTSLR